MISRNLKRHITLHYVESEICKLHVIQLQLHFNITFGITIILN